MGRTKTKTKTKTSTSTKTKRAKPASTRMSAAWMGEEIANLSCDAITSIPVSIDWTDAPAVVNDDDERPWQSAECVECGTCGRLVVAVNGMMEEHASEPGLVAIGYEGHPAACKDSGEYHSSAEGPMMNYYYPCDFDGDLADAARTLGMGCVCAVQLADGTKALALTGGGMDLSWEICEAFVKLGFCPPLHFAGRLPMDGRKLGENNSRILNACRKSAVVAQDWARRAEEAIVELRERLYAEAGKRTGKAGAR